jgi:hypothetical protein
MTCGLMRTSLDEALAVDKLSHLAGRVALFWLCAGGFASRVSDDTHQRLT